MRWLTGTLCILSLAGCASTQMAMRNPFTPMPYNVASQPTTGNPYANNSQWMAPGVPRCSQDFFSPGHVSCAQTHSEIVANRETNEKAKQWEDAYLHNLFNSGPICNGLGCSGIPREDVFAKHPEMRENRAWYEEHDRLQRLYCGTGEITRPAGPTPDDMLCQ